MGGGGCGGGRLLGCLTIYKFSFFTAVPYFAVSWTPHIDSMLTVTTVSEELAVSFRIDFAATL
jgi:hypothetical protein